MTSPSRKRPTQRLHLELLERRQMLAGTAILPLAGDFDAAAGDSVGLFDQPTGQFLLRNENSAGFVTDAVRFGAAGAELLPLSGDWDGNGSDTPGLYDPLNGDFFLKNDLNPGAADVVFGFGGTGGDLLPLVGDWDGDGSDGVGLYDQVMGKFFLKNTPGAGAADLTYGFGPKGLAWLPVAGDWDSDTLDTVGLYDPATGDFFLRNAHAGGPADVTFSFGPAGAGLLPLAGDWDNDAAITVGLHDPANGEFFLRNSLTSGPADETFYVAPLLDQLVIPTPAMSKRADGLTAGEVEQLLDRAAAASPSEDAIIAVVDRGGRILGVRVEQGVLDTITDEDTLVFAIDGAVAKARTAAFFANGDPDNGTLAPLTSRLVRFISQSTITERMVEANPSPNIADPQLQGPGFVAPIGLGGHFPPEIPDTPVVDLFAIEHTNRDGTVHPGADGVRSTITLDALGNVTSTSGDDILLPNRFNVPDAFIPAAIPVDQRIVAPDSYGFASGRFAEAQARGIATLPGGIPLYKDGNDSNEFGDTLVGGIGVFFPGPDGFATHEQNFIPYIGQTEKERTNSAKTLESEWIAFAAAGGSAAADRSVGALDGVDPVPGFDLPFGRLTLVGIELEVYGPHPDGLTTLVSIGTALGTGDSDSGDDQTILDADLGTVTSRDGVDVPEGWLVLPHASEVDDISAAEVESVIRAAVNEALLVRAAVRLPLSSRTRMVLSVADTDGNVLGLYRMQDATVFSIDVAVAKARNTAYYNDATAIQDIDRVDEDVPQDGVPDVDAGVSFTNRTFRFLAEARFPDGVEGSAPGPFSVLNDPGSDPATGENLDQNNPADADEFTSVHGHDAFNPATNFRDPDNIANQNGIVFFPGSAGLYEGETLLAGFGVSGDGVDQDDVVTFFGAAGLLPEDPLQRADEILVRGVRLPYIKFLRNPEGG